MESPRLGILESRNQAKIPKDSESRACRLKPSVGPFRRDYTGASEFLKVSLVVLFVLML